MSRSVNDIGLTVAYSLVALISAVASICSLLFLVGTLLDSKTNHQGYNIFLAFLVMPDFLFNSIMITLLVLLSTSRAMASSRMPFVGSVGGRAWSITPPTSR